MTTERQQWTRNAVLANMRQELMAPVNAIVGYAGMLCDEVPFHTKADLSSDLERILSSAHLLSYLSQRLLNPEDSECLRDDSDPITAQATIRHDLRTPLNAIKGYGEMLLEDADQLGIQSMAANIEKLLGEANRLLANLESIVDFSRFEPKGAASAEDEDAEGMVARLEQVIRPTANPVPHEVQPSRILVVDDNESVRDLLARRLTKDGHHVDTAIDGYIGLSMVDESLYDLILLDLMMPGLSGIETLTRIRKLPHYETVPVLMISALHEMDSVVRCIEAGANDYLTKPVETTLLTARINSCLERKQAQDREKLYLEQLKEEKRRSESLLLNILPPGIVKRMHDGEARIADHYDQVTIVFADLVDFSSMSSTIGAHALVDRLNLLFSAFDATTKEVGIEKIKTIGDAYMAAVGLPERRDDHAEAGVRLARTWLEATETINREKGLSLALRIGIHSGPVVAGVIGSHKFVYDVWGDTVNVAARMESQGVPGRVHLSADTARLLGGRLPLESRGNVSIKGKGEMETFLLVG